MEKKNLRSYYCSISKKMTEVDIVEYGCFNCRYNPFSTYKIVCRNCINPKTDDFINHELLSYVKISRVKIKEVLKCRLQVNVVEIVRI